MNFSTITYGYMRCTCERFPRVTRINEPMLSYLKLTEESPEWNNFYKENIYFMLPFEEREFFRLQLDAARASEEPICIRHHIISADNRCTSYLAWIRFISPDDNPPFYSMVYTRAPINSETFQLYEASYLSALKYAYDLLFEINLRADTVKCIHEKETSRIGSLFDVNMTLESARSFWLTNYIAEEDREQMGHYFDRMTTVHDTEDPNSPEQPLKTTFHIHWKDNLEYQFEAVTVPKNETGVLLCLRDISQAAQIGSSPETHETPAVIPQKGIFARTFGHFDLFCNGEPIHFSNAKEKELLALLIDRKGGTLTSREAIAILWPDKTPDDHLKSRYRRLSLTLKRTLEKYNSETILNSKNGTRNIDTSKLTCDYYELLNNNETYANTFHNIYMPEYSWAEDTLASLWDYS